MRQARIALGMLLAALLLLAGGPGFRSREQFDEHFAKHGREFGNISQGEYLHLAQELRDAPAGGPILEVVKPHGVVTRFDKRSGAFGAYNRDRTIRTFFKPNDGERYFRRQAERP
jgi:pyocin large subunit-like protein